MKHLLLFILVSASTGALANDTVIINNTVSNSGSAIITKIGKGTERSTTYRVCDAKSCDYVIIRHYGRKTKGVFRQEKR